jgi:murein endopeptidase
MLADPKHEGPRLPFRFLLVGLAAGKANLGATRTVGAGLSDLAAQLAAPRRLGDYPRGAVLGSVGHPTATSEYQNRHFQ